MYELLLSWSSTWARLQRHGILRQTSSIPEPPASAAPSSPVRSSAGTALPDTSTCSPSADFGSPTEVCFAHPATHFIWSGFINCEHQESLHLSFCFNQSAICVRYFTLLLLFLPQYTSQYQAFFSVFVIECVFTCITPFMLCYLINKRPNDFTLPALKYELFSFPPPNLRCYESCNNMCHVSLCCIHDSAADLCDLCF